MSTVQFAKVSARWSIVICIPYNENAIFVAFEITVENIAAIIAEAWKQSFNLGETELRMRKVEIHNFAEAIVRLNSANA